MRMFWTLFFLGSLFAVAIDVSERRQGTILGCEISAMPP